jgi:3'-phosphoadenosine 5'-phosphosulfate sulfotransferase (PAPS reductase)/FAD synthetase
MKMVKHVLGISGGKDSAALAIYMSQNHSDIDVDYYTCDTGKELTETYELIERLNSVLGKKITEYKSIDTFESPQGNSFDHFLAIYGGYLPSSTARWCTKKMKLDPFEKEIGDTPTISYVGIRGDEDREGYISKKENIQSIFPFRRNIWSEDVINKALANNNIVLLLNYYKNHVDSIKFESIQYTLEKPLSLGYNLRQKLNSLLDIDVKAFNKVIFDYLKTTEYPVGKLESFSLIENDDVIGINEVFKILEESGVGIPAYYKPLEYKVEINGETKIGTYSRSRSGCFFCFFQQKIEWIWLLETHPELFEKAVEYEKEGYTWSEEPLNDLRQKDRVEQIKRDHYIRTQKSLTGTRNSSSWQEDIIAAEGEGCASCFI